MRRPWPALGRSATGREGSKYVIERYVITQFGDTGSLEISKEIFSS